MIKRKKNKKIAGSIKKIFSAKPNNIIYQNFSKKQCLQQSGNSEACVKSIN